MCLVVASILGSVMGVYLTTVVLRMLTSIEADISKLYLAYPEQITLTMLAIGSFLVACCVIFSIIFIFGVSTLICATCDENCRKTSKTHRVI